LTSTGAPYPILKALSYLAWHAGRVTFLAEAWAALGGDQADLERVRLAGPPSTLPARLPVTALAKASVAAAGLAAGLTEVRVDSRAVAVAFTSERHLRLDGEPQTSWDPLSGFFQAADGWVRLHANYPHHRERLLRALGPDLPAAVAELSAEEVERAVSVQGGLAVAVRTAAQWRAHPAGAALRDTPLVVVDRAGGGSRPRGRTFRVLDLTRVIAGPVATRTLALFGADVLRVDPPHLPELPAQHLDSGFGKRSTLLDLRIEADRDAFEALLSSADVVVCGYRSGALDKHGLSPPALLERYPGLVVATLNAWGPDGPWAGRRGFDSLVQAACGIALIEGEPGRLPAQALDHATGYLLAAAVLREIAEPSGGAHIHVSLARTAAWLLDHAGVPQPPPGRWEPSRWLDTVDAVTYARPPLAGSGVPRTWAHPPVPHGSSAAAWLP
jgi:CoA-transferase family III